MNVRPNFSWMTVGVRFMPLLLNRGGEVDKDREWLRNNA